MDALKTVVKRLPGIRRVALLGQALVSRVRFRGSGEYWERRYREGGSSGAGSSGRLAQFKAEVVNGLVAAHGLASVIEFGCGDGRQLSLARYPRYLGLDVSAHAIQLCTARFAGDPDKSFLRYDPQAWSDRAGFVQADLGLSLDVLYHLVEDAVFEATMRHLFAASRRMVAIYSSNEARPSVLPHIRHRRFTDFVAAQLPGWRLAEHLENPYRHAAFDDTTSFADFYVFTRDDDAANRGPAQPSTGSGPQ